MSEQLQAVDAGHGTTVYIRENTLDAYIYEEIFVREQYLIKPEDLRKFVALASNGHAEPKVIFDLGANIGMAAVYFAQQYPDAKIYSVEPDQENYELMLKNTKKIPNIYPILGAVWDETDRVHIANRQDIKTRSGRLNKASYMVESGEKDDEPTIQAYTIPELMFKYGVDVIDVCKIDVQGAEKRIFENDTSWLSRTRYLFIETHDRYLDGCFYAVVEAVKKHGFVYIGGSGRDGDCLFFAKKAMIMPFVEMIVTTKCNLRCRDCSNLIPAYRKMYDIPYEEICESIDSLLSCVDTFLYFKIHGGEPLLHKDIVRIVRYVAKQEKVKTVIIPTNGSYRLTEEVLKLLAEYRLKVKLVISNYEVCRDRHEDLLQQCAHYGVNVSLSEEKLWYKFDEVKDYGETATELSDRVRKCEMKRFPSFYRGRLYLCSRIANGVYLGMIPRQEEWEFDLLRALDAERRERFSKFIELQECDYCRYCSMNNVRCIKAGEQMR